MLVRLTLTAILFVRLIVTVVDLVAPPVRSDAVSFIELVVTTRELPGLTVRWSWNERENQTRETIHWQSFLHSHCSRFDNVLF